MKDFPIVKPRQLVMALIMSSFMTTPAQAGFIEDFYEDSAGLGQGNVTTAGIYQSSGLNVVTGGGFVYRAPRTEFTPFHFSPPKLSAGCGGIDLFMGALAFRQKKSFSITCERSVHHCQALLFSLPCKRSHLISQSKSQVSETLSANTVLDSKTLAPPHKRFLK